MTAKPPPPTDADMRQRLAQLVARYPGLHLREAARQLRTSVALVEYHVPPLEAAGSLSVERGKRYVRLFPPGFDHADRGLLAQLRGRVALELVLRLLESPLRHGELAAAVGLGKSTLSFHLRKLEVAGLVTQEDGRYRVVAPARVRRLIERHAPTPDVRADFDQLWSDFYGE